MSLPTGLFIDAPELHDASMHSLSQDTEEWPEELVQKLKERIPAAGPMSVIVKIMKKDEENGTATGSVVVSNAKKQAVVPVIVKDFMLYPLDVMICDQKLLPLTPDYFQACFSDNAVFQKIEEYPSYGGLGRFEDSNLWNATYPPSLGRYAYASAGYDILDSIADTASNSAISNLRETLISSPLTSAQLTKNGHAEVIKKLANLRPVNMNEFRQGADNLIRKDLLMFRKEGPNKYSILSNSNSVFSPVIHHGVGYDDLCTVVSKVSGCPQDIVNDVDQNGEKMLTVPVVADESEVYVDHGVDRTIEPALESGNYVIKKKNGVEVEGLVVTKVINFDMDLVPVKLFLGKTMSTVQTEISGIRVTNSTFQPRPQHPQTGQTGTFMYNMGPSKVVCTVPVTIQSVTDMGETVMKVVDLQGVTTKIRMSHANLERIANMDGTYLLPKEFKWIPMEGFDEVSSNIADFASKTAAQHKTANPVRIIYTGYSQFSMKGVEKYASAAGWDPTYLEGYQARFLLASLGMSSEKSSESIKLAQARGELTLHGLHRPPLKSEKIAAALPTARKMVKIAEGLRSNLIKEAGYVENSQTVDALLSLNFVNADNVSKFVAKIPALKAAISHLASLLIASRLGIKEIPEQSVSTSMIRLVEVVNGLEALRATQEG